MRSSPLPQLRSVFGPLAQNPPSATAEPVPEQQVADEAGVPDVLPVDPIFHPKTEIVLVPTCRIDGSELNAPWSFAEPQLWNWLRTTPIEHIDEQVFDGTDGTFWAWCRNDDGELRGTYLRFDTVGFDKVYELWGEEYALLPEAHDPLRREQAAYEVAKAFGCEDIVPPIAAREVNLVPLISDAIRDKVAQKYKIDPLLVDETFGIVAALQLVPLNGTNFVEHWATLGADTVNRFARASDAMRHSIYRVIALDFVLGTGNRTLADFMYNEANDTLVIYGMGVTFPSPLGSADAYLAQRSLGWERALPAPTQDPIPGVPLSDTDTVWLTREFRNKQIEECLMTFQQMSHQLTPEVMALVVQAIDDIGVPADNVAGFVARVAFLQEDPESVIANQFDFVRSILAPMRRGYGFDQGRNARIVEIVNETMSQALGVPYDFAAAMQAQLEQE